MNLDSAMASAARLSRLKQLATGSPCPPFPVDDVAEARMFGQVVTVVYKWYTEQMRDDVRHLASTSERSERMVVEAFGRLLNRQRHLDQHADYADAAEARAWRANVTQEADGSSDGNLSEALLGELDLALAELCEIAARIGRDPAKRQAWSELAASSPEEEVRAVFANMGRQPQQRAFDYAVRQFKSHPGLRSARSPQERAQVAELVAVGVTLAPLSVAYDEILDEFGLIGHQLGYALLILAHGVQATGVRGSRLIPVLQGVWHALQSQGQ